MKRKKITLNCPICNKEYEKDKSEYTRNQKKGRESYCSLSCSATARNKLPKINKELKIRANSEDNINHIKSMSGNKRDEFTPYRNTLTCTKRRKQHENNLDLEYLKELWELQNGICPYSKLQLQLPEYTNSNEIHPTIRASLDRIDPSKGYIKGNVQYVSTVINYMKSTMSHQETIDFLKLITTNLSFDKD